MRRDSFVCISVFSSLVVDARSSAVVHRTHARTHANNVVH